MAGFLRALICQWHFFVNHVFVTIIDVHTKDEFTLYMYSLLCWEMHETLYNNALMSDLEWHWSFPRLLNRFEGSETNEEMSELQKNNIRILKKFWSFQQNFCGLNKIWLIGQKSSFCYF